MEYELSEVDSITLLKLSGKVNIFSYSKLKSIFEELNKKECAKLILNLENVNIINSSGVGAILSQHILLKKAGHQLVLTTLSASSKRVFELLRLLETFEIYDNDQDAIKSMAAS